MKSRNTVVILLLLMIGSAYALPGADYALKVAIEEAKNAVVPLNYAIDKIENEAPTITEETGLDFTKSPLLGSLSYTTSGVITFSYTNTNDISVLIRGKELTFTPYDVDNVAFDPANPEIIDHWGCSWSSAGMPSIFGQPTSFVFEATRVYPLNICSA